MASVHLSEVWQADTFQTTVLCHAPRLHPMLSSDIGAAHCWKDLQALCTTDQLQWQCCFFAVLDAQAFPRSLSDCSAMIRKTLQHVVLILTLRRGPSKCLCIQYHKGQANSGMGIAEPSLFDAIHWLPSVLWCASVRNMAHTRNASV